VPTSQGFIINESRSQEQKSEVDARKEEKMMNLIKEGDGA
jgi:hypothetical protein